eukprot:GHVU01032138.1.p1 GENE.GHVU01032138.1~~GHVU01032138.1.p1  ORF type:complete len:504 (-),score=32.93 GHVU01032138.1:317-1828(-)
MHEGIYPPVEQHYACTCRYLFMRVHIPQFVRCTPAESVSTAVAHYRNLVRLLIIRADAISLFCWTHARNNADKAHHLDNADMRPLGVQCIDLLSRSRTKPQFGALGRKVRNVIKKWDEPQFLEWFEKIVLGLYSTFYHTASGEPGVLPSNNPLESWNRWLKSHVWSRGLKAKTNDVLFGAVHELLLYDGIKSDKVTVGRRRLHRNRKHLEAATALMTDAMRGRWMLVEEEEYVHYLYVDCPVDVAIGRRQRGRNRQRRAQAGADTVSPNVPSVSPHHPRSLEAQDTPPSLQQTNAVAPPPTRGRGRGRPRASQRRGGEAAPPPTPAVRGVQPSRGLPQRSRRGGRQLSSRGGTRDMSQSNALSYDVSKVGATTRAAFGRHCAEIQRTTPTFDPFEYGEDSDDSTEDYDTEDATQYDQSLFAMLPGREMTRERIGDYTRSLDGDIPKGFMIPYGHRGQAWRPTSGLEPIAHGQMGHRSLAAQSAQRGNSWKKEYSAHYSFRQRR